MGGAPTALNGLDITVIVAYLFGIASVGIWVGYRRNATSEQYFLASKSLGWFSIGAALFASNISTIHLVGLAASGAKEGMVIGNFEWMASFCLIILGLVFAPFYFRSRITTLPEFLERRYGPSARAFLALIGIAGALLIHIGISLFAAAKLFESFLGVGVMTSILVISVVTVIYTVLGGLKGVVVTETIQTFLLLGGAVLITVLGLRYLSGAGIHDVASFQAELKPDQLSMVQPILVEGRLNGYSWLAVLLGYPILGIWYWCSDQTIVQRVLGARNETDAQKGPLFAGFLKILPVFLMVLPGVVGYIMFQKGDIRLPKLANGDLDYNLVLPEMVNRLVPMGLKGLIAAGMLAALMSTISSALNSCATLISVDIVKKMRPETPDAQQVSIGRISTGVVMVLAMLWSTQGDQFGSIFEAINKIPMVFAPAVTTVFVMGVFWRRGTNAAALATFAVSCALGVVYFVLDMPGIGRMLVAHPLDGFQGLVTDPVQGLGIPFMLVGPMLAALSVVIYVVTSLATPAPAPETIRDVCWEHPLAFLRQGRLAGLGDPRAVAAILLAIMVVLYFVMR
jgi:SSS family solute:Na+ symporter